MCALAVAMVSGGQNVKWQDLYKVKKKDTIYGIAKKFNITIEELQNANPGMKKSDYVLKKGDQLLIPFPTMSKVNTPAQSPETSRPATPPAPAAGKKKEMGVVRVGVMLPLHNVDGDGKFVE